MRFFYPQECVVPYTDLIEGINAPRPAVEGRHSLPGVFDVKVSFSRQRFRGQEEFSRQPAPGALRLAFLGDSFTFGFGANDEETYPAQLRLILQRELSKSGQFRFSKIEILNAGFPGTGTGEQALWYQRWVKEFHPQIVILNVHFTDVENDLQVPVFALQGNGEVSPRPAEELPKIGSIHRVFREAMNAIPVYSFLAQHSHLFVLLRNAATRLAGITSSIAGGDFSVAPYVSPYPGGGFYRKGLPLTAGEIVWLNGQVKSEGGKLVVVFVPNKEIVYALNRRPASEGVRRRTEAILVMLEEVCRREAIPLLDPTPLLRSSANSAGRQLYYSGRDEHLNPFGNRTFAQSVATLLTARKLLPWIENLRPQVSRFNPGGKITE